MTLRLLVVDAYDPAGRRALAGSGATRAGRLYERVLRESDPNTEVDVLEAGEGGDTPLDAVDPSPFAGLVWTGSNLTIHRRDEMVDRQVGLARRAFAAGVPQFGSCWAIQLAAVAAGGACGRNPRGREFGIARGIAITEAGATHPMLAGRDRRYEGFASHEDMVTELPAGGSLLATNQFSNVQALAVRHGRGVFWATQYHPEYDFHEVARLAVLRSAQLIREGRFAGEGDAATFIADFTALQGDDADAGARLRQQVSDAVADPASRRLEVCNWLQALRNGGLRS